MTNCKKFKRLVPQIIATLSCAFAVMSAGNVIGWLSPASLLLTAEGSNMPLNNDDIGWLSSILFAGAVIGSVFFGFLTDIAGRKWMNFTAAAFYILGWCICLVAKKVTHLYIARIIHGIGIAFALCLTPLYVGEAVEDHLRGAFTIGIMTTMSVGFLFIYSVGSYVNFMSLNAISFILPLLSVLTFSLMPESPHFLVMKGKIREAESELIKLRGETTRFQVINEMERIMEFLEESLVNETLRNRLKLLEFKKSLFPLLILTVLAFAQSFSGIMSLKSYFHIIYFLVDSQDTPYLEVVLAEAVGLVVSVCFLFFIDRLGRRIIFMVSSVGCIVSTTLVGIYYALNYYNVLPDTYYWMAVIGIYGFQIFYHVGLSYLPFLITSEIFPGIIKHWINAYLVVLLLFFGFCVTKLHQEIAEHFGYHFSFWLSSLLVLFSTVFLYIYLPETMNKSLLEIQQDLNIKKRITEKRTTIVEVGQ